ncbi:MAG TPA: hypothetical protein VF587_01065 [Solirubrobacteraceae bacterium]|jgi:hypothetical protein
MWTPLAVAIVAALSPPHEPARYTPGGHHATRPPGAIFNDEVGEDIVGLRTPYRRVVQVFGPPAVRRWPCVLYRQVGERRRYWRFCFDAERRMESAAGNVKA